MHRGRPPQKNLQSSTSDADLTGRASSEGALKRASDDQLKSFAILSRSERTGLRAVFGNLIDDNRFDLVMGAVIVLNVVVMIVETDKNADCASNSNGPGCDQELVTILNHMFLGVYTVEVTIRIYVLRSHFFRSRWLLVDLAVVLVGVLDIFLIVTKFDGLDALKNFKMLKMFRVVRALRVFRKIPELNAMLRGFAGAMYSMFWGLVMIMLWLMIFSILCVELVHPQIKDKGIFSDDAFCDEVFKSVWWGILSFFQTLVAGDSWGRCALPIMKEIWWSVPIFMTALVCVQLGFMNLILAVIVERAANAKEEDEEEQRRQRSFAETKATSSLNRMLKAIDADGSGKISKEELLDGFDSNLEMQNHFGKLGISRNDLEALFDLMNIEDEDELSYNYLIENLRTISTSDQRKNISMIRLQSAELVKMCKKLTDRKWRVSTHSSGPHGQHGVVYESGGDLHDPTGTWSRKTSPSTNIGWLRSQSPGPNTNISSVGVAERREPAMSSNRATSSDAGANTVLVKSSSVDQASVLEQAASRHLEATSSTSLASESITNFHGPKPHNHTDTAKKLCVLREDAENQYPKYELYEFLRLEFDRLRDSLHGLADEVRHSCRDGPRRSRRIVELGRVDPRHADGHVQKTTINCSDAENGGTGGEPMHRELTSDGVSLLRDEFSMPLPVPTDEYSSPVHNALQTPRITAMVDNVTLQAAHGERERFRSL